MVDTEVHPDAMTAFEVAGDLLRDLGHDVIDIARPFTPQVVPAFETVWRAGAAAIPLTAEQEELVTPLTRHLRELGGRLSAVDIFRAVDQMRSASSAALVAMSRLRRHPDPHAGPSAGAGGEPGRSRGSSG